MGKNGQAVATVLCRRRLTSLPLQTFFFCAAAAAMGAAGPGLEMPLNGTWDCGINRQYSRATKVPGLADDPAQPSIGPLWFRRLVDLPDGDWSRATLELKGARFSPQVYVNGSPVGSAAGGMAPLEIPLLAPAAGPGKIIVLEIALSSLRDLDPKDASAVAPADRWRTDLSSGLWDRVSLHLAGVDRLAHVVTETDWARRRLEVRWDPAGLSSDRVAVALTGDGVGGATEAEGAASAGRLSFNLPGDCPVWSPENPRLLTLTVTLRRGNAREDRVTRRWGLRDFRARGTRLLLNGAPVTLRGATVVWHRWLRDPAAATVAFDPVWFEANIVHRLKGYGANFLRFHLGLPPDALLDLCDQEGLLTQVEWPFFHSIPAAPESMRQQWRSWLETAARHPSVVLVQPWNEAAGPETAPAWAAFDAAQAGLPPFVVLHRDALPVHRYWWSLFENLGLYYDSGDAFGRPILADEFGGNYLDEEGLPGRYPAVRESLLRFLGHEQTSERRLAFQAESSARVAEYWRRIGAAGLAPFCALSGPQDGNTWFLGRIGDGRPKPVWDALAAAYAPISVSLDLWDRNFPLRGQVRAPVYLFNDSDEARTVAAIVRVRPAGAGAAAASETVTAEVPSHARRVCPVTLDLPSLGGEWRMEAELTGSTSTHPIVSSWGIRTLSPEAPSALATCTLGVPEDEVELRDLIQRHGLPLTGADDDAARVVVLGRHTWEAARRPGSGAMAAVDKALAAGKSVVWLDVGPRDLGPGYRPGGAGPMEAAPSAPEGTPEQISLPGSVSVQFAAVAEPESHVHPSADGQALWHHLPLEATWLWNGLRGGLVVPAQTMSVSGLNAAAFYRLWMSRGAFPPFVRVGPYYGYSLEGYYAFSRASRDAGAVQRLRDKVRQIAEDAPGLAIDPAGPVEETDLAGDYRRAPAQGAVSVVTLVEAGKGLTRTPVVAVGYGTGHGVLILSQLLTAGRLRPGAAEPGEYGLRYDPAAEQMVLNLLGVALDSYAPRER